MQHQPSSGRVTFSVLGSSILHAGILIGILTMEITSTSVKEITEFVMSEPAPAEVQETIAPESPATADITEPAPEETKVVALPQKTVAPIEKTAPPPAEPAPTETTVLSEASETASAPPTLEESTLDEHLDATAIAPVAIEDRPQDNLSEIDSEMKSSEALAEKMKQEEEMKAAEQAKLVAARHAQEKEELEKAQAQALAAAQAEAAAREEASRNAELNSKAQNEEVRRLEELKALPGNPKPAYDEQDRYMNRSGKVVFHAFISSEGRPSEIKLVQSSGHESLDEKTLKAIRDWKFVPGQEGWVEIPFLWDLKGEPKAIGGTLRKVSER